MHSRNIHVLRAGNKRKQSGRYSILLLWHSSDLEALGFPKLYNRGVLVYKAAAANIICIIRSLNVWEHLSIPVGSAYIISVCFFKTYYAR